MTTGRRPLWSRLAAIFFLVGLVLSPLRAVAATVPMLIAYDAAVQRTATVRVEARPYLQSELGGAFEYVYDDAPRGHEGGTKPRARYSTGAIPAYDGALEATGGHEEAEGVIYDASAATTAAEGAGALADTAAGGHLLARHVGLDAAALDARLAAQGNLTVASSFGTSAEAETARSTVFGQNAGAISSWTQAGAAGRLTVSGEFSGGTIRVLGGYSADATGATFVLQGNGAGGFFTLTGFPTL